jgi:hypothetical protein
MAKVGRKPLVLNLQQLAFDRSRMPVLEIRQKYGVSLSTLYKNFGMIDEGAHLVPGRPTIGFAAPVAKMEGGEGVGTPDPITPKVIDPETVPSTPLPERAAYSHNTYRFGHAPAEAPTDPAEILAKDYDFQEYYAQFCDFLGFKADRFSAPETKPILEGAEFSVIAADLHVPYEHQDAIKWMIKRTFKKANRLIIGGDLADMFYFSKYQKFKNHMSPTEAMVRVMAQLTAFSEAYDEVVLMRGNHDDRFVKWLVRMGIEPEVLDLFKYLYGVHAIHPIYVLAAGLKNVKVVEPINKDYAEFSYLYQQEDCIISHAEKYSKIPNKAASDVIQSLKSFHEPQGVVKPFKVLVQCHTHQAGKTFNDFGVIGIENGCLALLPDYSGGSKMLPHRAPVLGFTELHQVRGVADLEKTNFIPYQG